jgi:hypothetical protein
MTPIGGIIVVSAAYDVNKTGGANLLTFCVVVEMRVRQLEDSDWLQAISISGC